MKIKIEDLCVAQSEDVLRNINLEINSNSFFVLVGPSGCGKTTLLETICGLKQAKSGQILFGENNILNIPIDMREIGYVFQDYALYPNMTVEKNIEFGLKIKKIDKKTRKEKVQLILKQVELENKAKKYPRELSGGEKQRVAIGRALAINPKVLLMDEPLSNLDATLKTTMLEFIKKIHNENNITTIFVTHDKAEALAAADEIAVLNKGKIIQTGTPNEIYNEPQNEFVLKFFNNKFLNIFSQNEFNTVFDNHLNSNQNIYVRAHDIQIEDGENASICSIILQGEIQIIKVKQENIYVYIAVNSNEKYYVGDKCNIKYKRYYTF